VLRVGAVLLARTLMSELVNSSMRPRFFTCIELRCLVLIAEKDRRHDAVLRQTRACIRKMRALHGAFFQVSRRVRDDTGLLVSVLFRTSPPVEVIDAEVLA
jgi:hypothetical protein